MSYRGMGNGGEGRPPPPAMAMGLARQSSIYSLTLDEFQHTLGGLGKDFGSMNMDEFLKSVWIAEETQAIAMASAVGFGDTSAAAAAAAAPAPSSSGPMVATGLQRQGSLTLPRTISLKTVDEVWRDIARGESSGVGTTATTTNDQKQWQTSANYGEMTLEEFLGKAGVVREDAVPRNAAAEGDVFGGFPVASTSDNSAGRFGLAFPTPAATSNGVVEVEKAGMNSQQQQACYDAAAPAGAVQLVSSIMVGKGAGDGRNGGIGDAVAGTGMGGFAGGGNNVRAPAAGGSPVGNGDLPSLSPSSCVFNTGIMEKAVERRQKRMIKNRESAARSRARKQAYTMELEAEVAKLKEQNQELMIKQEKILEMQKKQILESSSKQEGSEKRKLRRTQTGPW